MADEVVGRLRLRSRTRGAIPAARLVVARTLLAAELARVRAPERASEEAAAASCARCCAARSPTATTSSRGGRSVGVGLEAGAAVIVARAHPRAPRGGLAAAHARRGRARRPRRGARHWPPWSRPPTPQPGRSRRRSRAAHPRRRRALVERVTGIVARELETSLPALRFAIAARASPPIRGPAPRGRRGLARRQRGRGRRRASCSFEETGAYRLLLPSMSEHPAELGRFYSETLETVVAYDEQYGTELVRRSRRSWTTTPRRRHLQAALHAPPHGALPARAGARADRPRRGLLGRPREALAGAEGDARARHPCPDAARLTSSAPRAAGSRATRRTAARRRRRSGRRG